MSTGAELSIDPYLLSIRLSFPPPKMGKSTEPYETRKHITLKIWSSSDKWQEYKMVI